jgi:hypothetical protein
MKLVDKLENKDCRSTFEESIRQEQLENLASVKQKLKQNIRDIKKSIPPIASLKNGVTYRQLNK